MAHTTTVTTEYFNPKGGNTRPYNSSWWSKKGTPEGCGPDVVVIARQLEQSQAGRRESCLRYAKLAFNQPFLSTLYDTATARTEVEELYKSWNVCASACGTAASMIVRNKPRVVFETTGGDFALQRQARLANKFVFGVWAENELHERHAPMAFQDAATFGLGVIHVFVSEGRVKIERVLPTELIFSDREWVYGAGRQLGRVKHLDRGVVLACWGKTDEQRSAILAVQAASDLPAEETSCNADLIPVYEFYRLPSKKGAKDGVHVLAVDGLTLHEEDWEHSFFPFAFLKVEERPVGLWGIGFVERLIGFQIELNEINDCIADCRMKLSSPKWMVEVGSDVDHDTLTANDTGTVVEYSGTAPSLVTFPGIPRELIEERQTTYQQALKEIGLSEWSTNGTKPAGLSSGEALRTVRDQEAGRMVCVGQAFEAFHVTIAELTLYLAAEAYSENKDYQVKAKIPGARFLEKIDFKKFSSFVESEAWMVKGYPVNQLPQSPAGRREALQEWLDKGIIDKATFASLMDMPDIDRESSIINAGVDDLKWTIERILDEGEAGYAPPEEGQSLELGIKMFQAANLRARIDGVDTETRDLLQRWIDDARDLLKPPAPVNTNAPVNDNGAPPPAAKPPPTDPNAVPPGPAGDVPPPPIDPATGLPPQLPSADAAPVPSAM